VRIPRTIYLLPLVACLAGGQSSLRDQVVGAERAELDALKSGNTAAFADLIAEEAVFVDSTGTASKSEVVKHIADFRLREYTMSNIQFVPVSAVSGVVVYRLTQTGISHNKEFTATVLASALWMQRNGKWVCVFSQETPAK